MNFLLSISMLLDLAAVGEQVNKILGVWVGPLFTAIGGAGAIYIIVLAVQYIRSENDNKKAEIKSRMVNCIIGVISILVLAAVCMMVDWAGFVQIFGYTSDTVDYGPQGSPAPEGDTSIKLIKMLFRL